MGRDVLSRVLFGTLVSLGAAVVIIAASLAIGVPIGLLAGAAGGWIDDALMRVVDVFLAFPSLLLALAIGAALGPSLEHAAIAIIFAWWPWYARLMRGEAAAHPAAHVRGIAVCCWASVAGAWRSGTSCRTPPARSSSSPRSTWAA